MYQYGGVTGDLQESMLRNQRMPDGVLKRVIFESWNRTNELYGIFFHRKGLMRRISRPGLLQTKIYRFKRKKDSMVLP